MNQQKINQLKISSMQFLFLSILGLIMGFILYTATGQSNILGLLAGLGIGIGILVSVVSYFGGSDE